MILLLLAILIVIPTLEIYLFIEIGTQIGALSTIGFIFLTAALGITMVRSQGLGLLLSAKQKVDRDEIPANELFEGLCILLAGALLLIPGFFTDLIGFLLLIPPIRHVLRNMVIDSFVLGPLTGGWVSVETLQEVNPRNEKQNDPRVIDADFEVVEKNQKKTD